MAKCGRSVVIELNALRVDVLALLGKTVSEVILLALNRFNQTITHLMVDLIGDQTIEPVVPLVAIQSKLFSQKYFQRLSKIRDYFGNNGKQLNTNISKTIALELRHIKESIGNCVELQSIDVTFISGRHSDQVLRDLCQVLSEQQMDYSFLSMINILCIELSPRVEPFLCGPSGPITRRSDFQIPEEFIDLFEVQTISMDANAMDGYFKVWLYDLNVESENVCIFIDKTNESFVIKCNRKEGIIELANSPFAKSGQQLNSSQTQSNNSGIDLQIEGLVRSDGLCDSVVYGIPYILSASRSPNLSFDELQTNSNQFYALIQVMNEKNALIILRDKQKTCPNSFYALLSSPDTKTLVMKSIATKELVLPYFNDSVQQIISNQSTHDGVVDEVRQHLNAFTVSDIYNPLYVSNNLFEFLSPDPSTQH